MWENALNIKLGEKRDQNCMQSMIQAKFKNIHRNKE